MKTKGQETKGQEPRSLAIITKFLSDDDSFICLFVCFIIEKLYLKRSKSALSIYLCTTFGFCVRIEL